MAALAVALLAATPGHAAEAVKRPLSHQDFDGWRTIAGQVISRDGHYLAYSYMPLEGDGDVIIRELTTSREQRVPVGALPPPPLTPSDADPERPAPRRGVNVVITSDSRFAIATTFPTQAETLQAKRDRKKNSEMPPEGLVLINLADGAVLRVSGVKSLQVPARSGAWLAYLKTTAPSGVESDNEKFGTDLVLRDLVHETERTFPNVLDYSLARDGKTLVFTVSSKTETENGVYVVTPGNPAAPLTLLAGPGRYLKFSWDREQTQAAFVSDHDEVAEKTPRLSVYHWARPSTAAVKILASDSPGVPKGSVISGDAVPVFSYDSRKLYVSTAPAAREPDPRLATLLDDEKLHADLWRWNDDFLPTVQEQRADLDRKRAYVGVLDLATRHFVQLADPSLATLTFTDDGSLAFGLDDRPYRRRIDYDEIYSDLYLVDVASGTRNLVVRELSPKAGVRWSPDNRWIAYYANRQWFALDSRDQSIHPLSQNLPFPVYDERADMPEMPASHGTAAWTSDGQSLLIYDRFDLWQVFPDGRPARNVTEGFGRQNQIQLRLQLLDPNEPGRERRGIDLTAALTFRGESETTRDTGFFRFAPGAKTPERLLWANKDYRYAGRALDRDLFLLTASRFDEYPDILAVDANFSAPKKVTDGGAQLKPYLWGSAELINYHNPDGAELSAMLCKPANFDPKKKYPMIVYIYERLSQIVNRFMPPAPVSVIDPAFYTSNGYIVLMPDIVYTTGHPGQSAYRCVMAAVDAVVRQGYVDENALGLEGHSWGGYETSYIITQTNRFRAAEAGAIVGNMTSAYAGIGWANGRARLFKYEKNQSRIGASLTDAPQLYLENSPVFFAPKVNTPLLILHNDHDDVVPWYQAIEFFLALRRAGKEAYFFNYNDEFHSPRRRVAQKDFAKRMHQFFDHFLKGAPAPEWMTRGIPYLERDEEKIRFREAL